MRRHSRWIVTNPDMLHRGILPAHQKWSSTLRRVAYVVIDECHAYRGVFGSHVGHVLRRLRRICRRYGAEPVFVLASATVADPAAAATRLVGRAGRGGHRRRLAPPRRHLRAVGAAADRAHRRARGAAAPLGRRGRRDAARRPRRARRPHAGVRPVPAERGVGRRPGPPAAARPRPRRPGPPGGLLPRRLPARGAPRAGAGAVGGRPARAWRRPTRWSSASTSPGSTPSCSPAIPGTLASLWQQAGRAGRAQKESLVVFVARDDPLDHYLAHHPRAVFGRPIEATVTDPANPYVLGPQLCCAAAELPLRPEDLDDFGGPVAEAQLEELVAAGQLRRRPAGWYWAGRGRPDVDIRGSGGEPVSIIEADTGRLLGTVDGGAAHSTVHDGALYVHRGDTFVVDEFDVDDACAVVHAESPEWTTVARDVTDLGIVSIDRTRRLGTVTAHTGVVDVTNQVVAYQRRRLGTGEVLAEFPLDLPARQLRTRAVWLTLDERAVERAEVDEVELPGSLHAAEHAAIGILPLLATCDRWDLGGLSTALHPDTGDGDDLRLRRAPGRGRLQRARLRGAAALAAGDPGDGRQLRVRERLPLLRAVAQVRQRQRPARQGRRGPGARRRPRRAGRGRGPAREDDGARARRRTPPRADRRAPRRRRRHAERAGPAPAPRPATGPARARPSRAGRAGPGARARDRHLDDGARARPGTRSARRRWPRHRPAAPRRRRDPRPTARPAAASAARSARRRGPVPGDHRGADQHDRGADHRQHRRQSASTQTVADPRSPGGRSSGSRHPRPAPARATASADDRDAAAAPARAARCGPRRSPGPPRRRRRR